MHLAVHIKRYIPLGMAHNKPKRVRTAESKNFEDRVCGLLNVKAAALRDVIEDNVSHLRKLQKRWAQIVLFDYTDPDSRITMRKSSRHIQDPPEVQALFAQRDIVEEHRKLRDSVLIEAREAQANGDQTTLDPLMEKLNSRQAKLEKSLVELYRIIATISAGMRKDGKDLLQQVKDVGKFITAIDLHPASAITADPDVAALIRLAGPLESPDDPDAP